MRPGMLNVARGEDGFPIRLPEETNQAVVGSAPCHAMVVDALDAAYDNAMALGFGRPYEELALLVAAPGRCGPARMPLPEAPAVRLLWR